MLDAGSAVGIHDNKIEFMLFGIPDDHAGGISFDHHHIEFQFYGLMQGICKGIQAVLFLFQQFGMELIECQIDGMVCHRRNIIHAISMAVRDSSERSVVTSIFLTWIITALPSMNFSVLPAAVFEDHRWICSLSNTLP